MKGRRSTKTREERIEDLKSACNRSGLTGFEIVEVLVTWYGWGWARIRTASTETVVYADEKDKSRHGE